MPVTKLKMKKMKFLCCVDLNANLAIIVFKFEFLLNFTMASRENYQENCEGKDTYSISKQKEVILKVLEYSCVLKPSIVYNWYMKAD